MLSAHCICLHRLYSLWCHYARWLTTEESDKFAPILLQQSLKVTFESPPGIKKNLQRTYESWSEEMIAEGGARKAQLLFLLAWLHALVQERRTYIPQARPFFPCPQLDQQAY